MQNVWMMEKRVPLTENSITFIYEQSWLRETRTVNKENSITNMTLYYLWYDSRETRTVNKENSITNITLYYLKLLKSRNDLFN